MSETLYIIKYCILPSESKGNCPQNTEFVPYLHQNTLKSKENLLWAKCQSLFYSKT